MTDEKNMQNLNKAQIRFCCNPPKLCHHVASMTVFMPQQPSGVQRDRKAQNISVLLKMFADSIYYLSRLQQAYKITT